jgi:hypothetical protein
MILMPLFDLKSERRIRRLLCRDFKSTALAGGTAIGAASDMEVSYAAWSRVAHCHLEIK